MINYPKQLIDQFTSRIDKEYQTYCKRHQVTASHSDFISYLISRGILDVTTMKHFTILQEFKELYPQMRYHKTNTIKKLADKFHLSERSVWSIIKNNAK